MLILNVCCLLLGGRECGRKGIYQCPCKRTRETVRWRHSNVRFTRALCLQAGIVHRAEWGTPQGDDLGTNKVPSPFLLACLAAFLSCMLWWKCKFGESKLLGYAQTILRLRILYLENVFGGFRKLSGEVSICRKIVYWLLLNRFLVFTLSSMRLLPRMRTTSTKRNGTFHKNAPMAT